MAINIVSLDWLPVCLAQDWMSQKFAVQFRIEHVVYLVCNNIKKKNDRQTVNII